MFLPTVRGKRTGLKTKQNKTKQQNKEKSTQVHFPPTNYLSYSLCLTLYCLSVLVSVSVCFSLYFCCSLSFSVYLSPSYYCNLCLSLI